MNIVQKKKLNTHLDVEEKKKIRWQLLMLLGLVISFSGKFHVTNYFLNHWAFSNHKDSPKVIPRNLSFCSNTSQHHSLPRVLHRHECSSSSGGPATADGKSFPNFTAGATDGWPVFICPCRRSRRKVPQTRRHRHTRHLFLTVAQTGRPSVRLRQVLVSREGLVPNGVLWLCPS